MSQPPLTQAIRRLETELGVRLFERSRSGVSLTGAGRVLLEESRRMIAFAQAMVETTRQAAQGLRGRLRVSYVPSAGLVLLPRIAGEFRRRFPDVELALASETTTAQLDSLRHRRADVGVLVPPLRDANDIRVTPLRRERLVAAVPADHALAAQPSVRLSQLADEPFILFPLSQGPAFLSSILLACRRANFFPRVVQEAPQMQMILTLVACGVGVSLVPACMRCVQQTNVRFLRLEGPVRPEYEIAIATREGGGNEIAASFVAVAKETIGLPRPSRRA